ncbi:hypothetical protein MJM99_35665, partial [Salmonella enterica subsp. enterica serovar Kentucky]|nr:hypothetical protein [Salmonella enterica subsp. enterica serovar Kentucky]
KELLQEECEPQKLAEALLPLLANGKTSHAMHDTFRELHQQIRKIGSGFPSGLRRRRI